MDKAISSEMENVENPESTVINQSISHQIKKLVQLRRMIEESNKKMQYLRNQTSRLLESNRKIEVNYAKLVREMSDINAKISTNTKTHVTKMQQLKDFQSMRTNTSHKHWDNSLSVAEKYASDFSQWITEYSRNVLLKDIENHREECKNVGDELKILQRGLNDMRSECDFDYIRADVDVDADLANLDGVMSDTKSDNSNLMHTITLTEDTLNKIKIKIKQSKIAVNKYKT